MTSDLDAVRPDEAFDAARLDTWLKAQLPELSGEPTIRQFTGGASNLTYLLRYPSGQDLILRRPPAGAPAAAHDVAREYRVQALLKPVFPQVPTVRALCSDHSVIGGDFYIMDRVDGLILRGRSAAEHSIPTESCQKLAETFVDTLVHLHSIDPAGSGLAGIGKGDGYVRRQVEGWCRRYSRARTDDTRDYKTAIAARLTETAREAGAANPEQLGEQLALLLDGASARTRVLNSECFSTAAAIAAVLIDSAIDRAIPSPSPRQRGDDRGTTGPAPVPVGGR